MIDIIGLEVNSYLRVRTSDGTILEEVNTTCSIEELTPYADSTYVANIFDFTFENGKVYKLANGFTEIVGDNTEVKYIKDKTKKVEDINVNTITISTGKEFDADEVSQNRMCRAVVIASNTNQTTTLWRLANNVTVEVTLNELIEALALSGQAMSTIWLDS